MLVGCKVTLRHEGCDDFVNTLSFTFPRREKMAPVKNVVSTFMHKTAMLGKIKPYPYSGPSGTPYRINANFILTLGELILFYPIELGLGLHPDVRQVVINFNFTSVSIEERYFFLRQANIPVFH